MEKEELVTSKKIPIISTDDDFEKTSFGYGHSMDNLTLAKGSSGGGGCCCCCCCCGGATDILED